MKIWWVCLLAVVILAFGSAWAQQPNAGSSDTLAYENGSVANNVYTNECFGFSLAVPDGWHLNTQVVGADGKAKHAAGVLILLVLEPNKEGSSGKIVLTARAASASGPSQQEFVSQSVHTQVDADREHRQMVKEAYPVDYSGKGFYRADLKQARSGGGTLFVAYIYTKFRGNFIGETLMAGSPEELEQSANALQLITFREDTPNSKCVMGPGDVAPSRVRVSEGVARSLLIKKVTADYPELAKQARVQGQVVLQARIDKEGNVEDIKLVSGHPMLAPAAIAAVKQWKYKPYLLNGQAVAMETQIVVNFSLS